MTLARGVPRVPETRAEILHGKASLWPFAQGQGVSPTNETAKRTARRALIRRATPGINVLEDLTSCFETDRRHPCDPLLPERDGTGDQSRVIPATAPSEQLRY